MSKNEPAGLGAEILPYSYLPDPQIESSSEFSAAARGNRQAGETFSPKGYENNPQNAVTRIGTKILRLIWLSIILGLVMEATLILIALWFDQTPSLKPLIADLVQKISWSTIVCLGLGVGTALSKLRMPLAGLAGLFAAPLAFQIARSLHKGAAEALAVMAGRNEYYSPLLMGLVKGLEYACLGLVIVWLGKQAWGKALAHLGAGLWIGLVFGSIILILIFGGAPKPIAVADFVSRGVNEVFFPIGCSLVVFTANTIGKMAMEKA